MGIYAMSGTVKAQVNSVAVTSATKTKPEAQPAEANQKATHSKPQPAVKDSVQISSASQAAYEEATETTTQTAQEARNGDHQAQRLLAKEAAAKLAAEGPVKQNETPLKV